jgi:hypothetical protein
MKPNTDNNNYSGSPNKPLLCECNLFHSRWLLIKFLERCPSSAHGSVCDMFGVSHPRRPLEAFL